MFKILRTHRQILIIFVLLNLGSANVLAGIRIVTNDTEKGGTIFLTNMVVMKIETNAMRMDIGTAFSVIDLPDSGGQVQLFHLSKTYQWQMDQTSSPETNPPAQLPAAIETTFDGFPARLFCFTNGIDYSHVWVASAARFLGSTNIYSADNMRPPDLSKLPRPGFPVDSNSIVVATEYGSMTPIQLSDVKGSVLE